MKIIKFFILELLLFLPLSVLAKGNISLMNTPSEAVKVLTDTIADVVGLMSSDNGNNNDDIKRKVVDQTVDLFDFNRITALAVGFPWKNATLDQKMLLSKEFRCKLINAYYNVFIHVRDTKVEIKQNPIIKNKRREIIIQSTATSVRSDVGDPIEIDYFLYKTEQGYKIYNINVQGISLVTTYRGQFSEIIQESGVDGLIQSLQEENNQLNQSKKKLE
ncbi:MAG: hypothetical protein GKC53_04415 [Neisseriaceae bacterium]|nr:MAG: hypothetical protein GKC53_04415 [Neisseriaceae bacterium]